MRIKTFTAPTNAAAMNLVRTELGEDAIIISSGKTEDGDNALVVAAIELSADAEIETLIEEEPARLDELNVAETVRQALLFHGAPPRLAERLAVLAAGTDAPTPTLALAAAIDANFRFSLLGQIADSPPLMLVGPPGGGKTIVAAKLCTQETLAGRKPIAFSSDTRRAGGVEQLKAFTNILGIDLITVDSVRKLRESLTIDAPSHAQIIDTAATNPYDTKEMDALQQMIMTSGAEPILVLAAGGDPMEAADVAKAYKDIGVTRFIATQLDVARRAGGLLAAADGASLAFADVSGSCQVSEQLKPVSPVSLARLIMPHTDEHNPEQKKTEAAE